MGERNVIGVRVRKARKAAKPPITQLDLVARLQVQGVMIDQSTLSKIESGVRPVSDVEVVAFAAALKVSAAWLLGLSKVSDPESSRGEATKDIQ